MSVQEVKQQIEIRLNQLKKFFVPEMELTFIARKPDNDRADFVVTNDSLPELAKVIERMSKQSGARCEVQDLRDLERSYTQRLGEMSRLSDIVCKWALEHSNISEESPEVAAAANEIMEYIEAVRPPEGQAACDWVVHILGPDDVHPCVSQFEALRKANLHNIQFAKLMADDPSPNAPYCVAVVKNRADKEVSHA